MPKFLVTGCAGFIGYHVSERLLNDGDHVVGADNLNPYYDPKLKLARLARLQARPNFAFVKLDLTERENVAELFRTERFEVVVHLAAQAGVRYSLTDPFAYVDANLAGFATVLEGCRHNDVQHLVFASSSSVYGANTKLPFSVHDPASHPVSLYGATKKANELMVHAYAHLFRLPCTGLRFFTVYGPWGRPDMALFSFARRILEGQPIDVYNQGNMQRDFTYIDDVVECLVRVTKTIPQPDPTWHSDQPDEGSSTAPYRIYNIGNGQPVPLMNFVRLLESELGKKALIRFLPLQAGDVQATHADTTDLERAIGPSPHTSIEAGIKRFVAWYREYYGV
ncbi:MAG: NAD-dependent epimerase [Terriglobia bacterium]